MHLCVFEPQLICVWQNDFFKITLLATLVCASPLQTQRTRSHLSLFTRLPHDCQENGCILNATISHAHFVYNIIRIFVEKRWGHDNCCGGIYSKILATASMSCQHILMVRMIAMICKTIFWVRDSRNVTNLLPSLKTLSTTMRENLASVSSVEKWFRDSRVTV